MIRVTCVDDKLDQVNATVRNAERRLEALREAVESGDEGRRNHEFTVLTVMHQNLRTLDSQAGQCVGQDIYDTGTTRVETFIEEGTPEEDITDIPGRPLAPTPLLAAPPRARSSSEDEARIFRACRQRST